MESDDLATAERVFSALDLIASLARAPSPRFPIEQAGKGIGQTFVSPEAALISFVAMVVACSPLILLVLWGVHRWKRRDGGADQIERF